MAQYRLFYFDGFRLTGSDLVEAADECDAMLASLHRARGRGFELWRGGAKLHVFPPADRHPADCADAPRPEPCLALLA